MDKKDKEKEESRNSQVCCGTCGSAAVEVFLLEENLIVVRCADEDCRRRRALLLGYEADEQEAIILLTGTLTIEQEEMRCQMTGTN